MTIEELIQEFESEAKTTRRVLERVPSDKLAWAPHTRLMSLGRLAMHLASAPGAISGWPVTDHFQFTGDLDSRFPRAQAISWPRTTAVWSS